ncbi:MAG: alpha/beta hydrolase [Actinomycetota bacterium]
MATLTAAAASDLFRADPDRYVEVPGIGEAAVRTVGAGPDVLFVHGWPVSGATFRLLLPHLVDHVTCHVIDMPGTGSSRFDDDAPLSIASHMESVRRAVDALGLDSYAAVGHDSGGLIARHAVVGDHRLRALGLINTEPPEVGWRFRSFLMSSRLPGFGAGLGWLVGKPKLRRNKFVLGDAFVDRSLLDGEFDEFFLRPLATEKRRLVAGMKLIGSFEMRFIDELADIHGRIDVPVQMVWGAEDPFFPLAQAKKMVGTFPDAQLEAIPNSGLFSHEETPQAVAEALLPALTG